MFDIMTLFNEVIAPLQAEGVDKLIFIGENVLNFFGSDDEYYMEWTENADEGWAALINFRPHVLEEMSSYNVDHYLLWGGQLNDLAWRKLKPEDIYQKVNSILQHRLIQ